MMQASFNKHVWFGCLDSSSRTKNGYISDLNMFFVFLFSPENHIGDLNWYYVCLAMLNVC